jgi:hypothetical protein
MQKEIKIIIDDETNTTSVRLTGEFTKAQLIGYLELTKHAAITKSNSEQNPERSVATEAK